MLFNLFIDNLDIGMNSEVTKFVVDTNCISGGEITSRM